MTQILNLSQIIPNNISSGITNFFSSPLNSPTSQTFFVIALIALTLIVIFVFKKFIINSILGIVGLLILNAIGIKIGITIVNVLLCGALGLVGLAILLVLHLLGIPV